MILIVVAVVLSAAAIGLAGFCLHFTFRAGKASEEALGELIARGIYQADDAEEYADYKQNPYVPMPVEEIDGHRYIGIISIPDIELELPVIENWDYEELKIAPCRYFGSVYTDNLIICGHNHSKHFLNIKKLYAGTQIFFTDVAGNEFEYKLIRKDTIDGDDVEGMLSGEWDMTLFTCSPLRTDRVALRCQRLNK